MLYESVAYVCVITWSLKVWFSACTAASCLSFSLSFSSVFSQVLFKVFTSSLMSTLFRQFSRRDFCKGNLFYSSTYSRDNEFQLSQCRSSQSVTLICYLQANVSRYKRAVHLIKAVHGCSPNLHFWFQASPMWVGSLQTHMPYCIFIFIRSFTGQDFDVGVKWYYIFHIL